MQSDLDKIWNLCDGQRPCILIFYRFMDLCNAVNCRVDYISVHRYGGVTILFKHEFFSVKRVINLKDYYKNLPPGTAEHIMEMIDDLYRRWSSLFTIALSNTFWPVIWFCKIDADFALIQSLKFFRHGKKIWLNEFAMSGTSNADKVGEMKQLIDFTLSYI